MTSKKLLEVLSKIKMQVGPFYPSASNRSTIVPVWFDPRHVFSNHEIFKIVIEELTRLARKINKGKNEFDFLVGIPTVGIPIASAISLLSGIPFLYLEKKEKKVLTGGLVQGEFKKGDTICLVDDTMGSGGTKFEAIKKAKKVGLKVKHLLLIWNSLPYTNQLTIKKLNKMGIKVHYLTTRYEIAKYMYRKGVISKETFDWHNLWIKNPDTWYKNKKTWQEFLEWKKKYKII